MGARPKRLTPGQLALYLSGEGEAEVEQPEPEEPGPPKKHKGHGRLAFANDSPRDTVEIDLPEDERACPSCGKEMCAIGEDVTERGHFVPARLVVGRYVKKKYACPDGHAVKTAEAPTALIDRCKYEPSVYAHVAASKYCDHDEGAKGSRKGYVWDWRAPGGDGADKSLVQFTMTRERHGPKAMLGKWSGKLVTDGYSGFDEVCRENGIVRAGCWAHARRKLKEALNVGSKDAAPVLVHVQRLFWIERAMKQRVKWRGQETADLVALRGKMRPKLSRRIIERLYSAAGAIADKRSTMRKSKLGKALGYLFNQRPQLEVFLQDPRVEIHNNDAERDLRHVVVGRNNWMVFASPRGGEVASRLYSLVLSCKHAGVDPEAYIEDVLVRVSTTPASEVASLTPWAWATERTAAATPTN